MQLRAGHINPSAQPKQLASLVDKQVSARNRQRALTSLAISYSRSWIQHARRRMDGQPRECVLDVRREAQKQRAQGTLRERKRLMVTEKGQSVVRAGELTFSGIKTSDSSPKLKSTDMASESILRRTLQLRLQLKQFPTRGLYRLSLRMRYFFCCISG